MDDLIDDARPGENTAEFSVSELSGAIRRAVEQGFSHVRVRGEVGRVSRPASGHLYLDLKDDRAVLSSVIWRGVAKGLRTKPEEGMEVVATGRITTFPGQSRYQLIIEHLAPAGLGALMALLEKRKAALAAEGLFDADRKRAIPYLPGVVGVITSPSGAVIRDILHRLRDRFPRQVIIWPVTVQGEKCAREVAAALQGFNALEEAGPVPRPELLIVARGGGSVEDLWGFNEEVVVRAVADSRIPVISAVGHETDTTLIDFVADLRAPTPTAAAELAVPVRAELVTSLGGLEDRRRRGLARLVEERRARLAGLGRLLPRPSVLIGERSQTLDELAQRLPRALTSFLRARRAAFAAHRAGEFGPRLLNLLVERARHELAMRGAGRLNPRLLAGLIARQRDGLTALGSRMPSTNLMRSAERERGRLHDLQARLNRSGPQATREARERLARSGRLLESFSYRRTLARGFAVVRDGAGGLISEAGEAGGSAKLEIEFRDGRLAVLPARPAPRKAASRRTPGEDPQGSLF